MSHRFTRREFAVTAGAAVSIASVRARGEVAAAKPLVIDSHVHLKHGDAAKTEWSAEDIVNIMDRAGIDKSVVFAMSTTTARSIEMAEAAIAKFPDRLIAYLYALPSYERPVLREIEAALAGKIFRGIKIHAGECTLQPYIIDPVIRLAGQFGAPCLIDVAGNPSAARRIAKEFPGTKIIYAHMGRYLSTDESLVEAFIRAAEECPNVLLDLSAVALVYKIEEAVRRIGSLRIVWGSDGPYKNPDTVSYVRSEMEKVKQLAVSDADKANMLGLSIAKLLGISGQT